MRAAKCRNSDDIDFRSGKHHEVVLGSNLITLPWTDGDRKIPCDDRLDNKTDGRTCGVERSQARSARAQRNHIGMALRAFLAARMELLHHRRHLRQGQETSRP